MSCTVQYSITHYVLLIKSAKRTHAQKLEHCYAHKNTYSMWQGIQAVTNYKVHKQTAKTKDLTLTETLNSFYAHFDNSHLDTS